MDCLQNALFGCPQDAYMQCMHGGPIGRAHSPLHPLGVPDQLRGGGGGWPRRRRLRVARGFVLLAVAGIAVAGGGASRRGTADTLVAVAVAAAAVLGPRRGRRPAAAPGLVGEHGHELVVVQPVELAGRAVRGRHLDEGDRVAQRPPVRSPPRRRELGEVIGPRRRRAVLAPLRPVVHRRRDPGRQLRHRAREQRVHGGSRSYRSPRQPAVRARSLDLAMGAGAWSLVL